MPFAQNLKRLRLARELTQEQLALACGWSGQSRIANYEATGPKPRSPKIDEIPKIARALGVSISELFDDSGVSPERSQLPGLDPDIVQAAVMGLRRVFARKGQQYDPERDPEDFVLAYELLAEMEGGATPENLVDFSEEFEKRRQAREERREQERSSAATGSDAGRKAGRK